MGAASTAEPPPALELAALRDLVAAGTVDTVVLATVDMQGRLVGKRFAAGFFLDQVLQHGSEACSYLLAVDVEMETVGGYSLTGWSAGYGDVAMTPDLGTLRLLPWQEATALVLADVSTLDGSPVAPSPRQVLRGQLDRLAERGWQALVGTELEFCLYDDSYSAAWRGGYRDLTPATRYNVDYALLDTDGVEPVLRALRTGMAGAGMTVESAKGECNLGQYEIAFRYANALTTCDNHSIYKTGAKQIAASHGRSLTFMAKPNAREGNSCHIHCSLRTADGEPVLAGGSPHGFSSVMQHFVAGQLACLAEFSLLFAPNVNSYKRYRDGSFAPTAVRWGVDNRTCALRVVGHGASLRVENRVPGGDVNPYLAVAGIIAAGCYGVDQRLALPEPCTGNAYELGGPRVAGTLREALTRWEGSELARSAFGDEVVDHYANNARIELDAFESAVTDWELFRGFERM